MTPEDVVSKTFGVGRSSITDATSNQSVADWDSLGHITLVLELESVYGVSFSPEEALEITNVAAIKKALERRGVAW